MRTTQITNHKSSSHISSCQFQFRGLADFERSHRHGGSRYHSGCSSINVAPPGGGGDGDCTDGQDGMDGTGGGCGAKERQSATGTGTKGGSGIVIIRYRYSNGWGA